MKLPQTDAPAQVIEGASAPPRNYPGIALRGIAVLSKLLLVWYIARYLPLRDLGVYGLFASSVGLAMYVLGYDFYTYATREIIAVPREGRAQILLNQAVFHAVAYAVVLPGLVVVFLLGFLPWSVAGLLYLALVGTHLSQEAMRLLTALSRPVTASIVSFLAHGIWPLPVAALGLAVPALRTIEAVFVAWCVGGAVATLVGLVIVYRLCDMGRGERRVDVRWIWRGLGTCSVFFLATLSLKLMTVADRYFVDAYRGKEAVGAYTFYTSMVWTLQNFVFAGFVMVLFPVIVGSYRSGNHESFRRHMRRLKVDVVVASAALVPCFVAGVYVVLWLVDKPELREGLPTYFILLGASVTANLAVIPHYSLYAMGRDKAILIATASGAGLNVALNALLVPAYGMLGAAIATAASLGVMGLLKVAFVSRTRPASIPEQR